jgi:Peptidase family M50.
MIEFRIKSCRVLIHFSIFALTSFLAIFADTKNGLLVFVSVLLHETAHLSAMLLFKICPKIITVSALGIRIKLDSLRKLSYCESFFISLAGPLSNLIAGFLCLSLGSYNAMKINLSIGLFHLLPLEPLDGGLALKALVSKHFDKKHADKICTIISVIVVFPLMVLGFMLLIHTKNNFSLLLLSVYAMLYLMFRNGKFEL